MRYISLPIHEKPDVVLDMARNFTRFLPEAMLVLHVSSTGEFSVPEISAILKAGGAENCIVNPNQVPTQWGNILNAHFCNLDYIAELNDATSVVFHASNDMLVRDGLQTFLDENPVLAHRRIIFRGGHWWPAELALDDQALMDGLAEYGSGIPFASQIEGSQYPADLLFDIKDEIERKGMHSSDLHYTKEEIILSSVLAARGIHPDGLPYVFSAVHDFDRALWDQFEDFPFEKQRRKSGKAKEALNRKAFKARLGDLTLDRVKAIVKGETEGFPTDLFDGNNIWQVVDWASIYGVKRVQRDMNDPIRQYIGNL